MTRYDLWWARFVRATAFLIGIGIALLETLSDNFNHPWAYAAAATFMGIPAANAFETLVRALARGAQEQPMLDPVFAEVPRTTPVREEKP